jgi:TfoX/Sxy family transcriptional regulator of competence genes
MEIPKPTEADKARFQAAVPFDQRVAVKPMFGNLGAFVNGNMFMGLFGADIGLKLPPSEAATLASVEGAGPFGPSERPMGGYVSIPPALLGTPEGSEWIERALGYVATLPPKKPR